MKKSYLGPSIAVDPSRCVRQALAHHGRRDVAVRSPGAARGGGGPRRFIVNLTLKVSQLVAATGNLRLCRIGLRDKFSRLTVAFVWGPVYRPVRAERCPSFAPLKQDDPGICIDPAVNFGHVFKRRSARAQEFGLNDVTGVNVSYNNGIRGSTGTGVSLAATLSGFFQTAQAGVGRVDGEFGGFFEHGINTVLGGLTFQLPMFTLRTGFHTGPWPQLQDCRREMTHVELSCASRD